MESTEHHHQIEPDTNSEPTVLELYETLQDQNKQLDDYFECLSREHAEILSVLYKPQKSDSTEEIKAIKQHIAMIEKGIIKVYQHIEKDNTGKELKSEQQLLWKAIEANQKKTAESSVTYLDWRQLTIIITATALAASLCSFAVFQAAASWKTDQPQNSAEKTLKAKSKKSSK